MYKCAEDLSDIVKQAIAEGVLDKAEITEVVSEFDGKAAKDAAEILGGDCLV